MQTTKELLRRKVLDARVLTAVFAYVFAIYSYIQPAGYRSVYPTIADRIAFAHSFENNKGLRLLYGLPHDVATVNGYTAWRVGGVLAMAAALYGLLAGVRSTRAEEDSGRLELVLSGPVSRRTVNTAALAAIAIGTATAWVAEFAGMLIGGLPLGGAAYLALSTASIIPVCSGVAALAGELAPDRRVAYQLAGSAIGLLFVLRVLADTVSTLGWLRWLTPLGWAEQLRPFAGSRPLVLVLPVVATVLLVALSARIAAARDIGTGVLPARDIAEPRTALLRSPALQAIRGQRGVLITWAVCFGVFSFILGIVAKSISPADVSKSIEKEIAKLGSGPITTPGGYLAFLFIFVGVAICVFVCMQIGAARQEELDQRLETLLATPVGRQGWLAGRVALAAAAAVAIALIAGVITWVGARAGGAHVSLAKLLEAGANELPVTALFLGIAVLAYALVPRISSGVTYGVLTASFLWQLVGSLVSVPKWLLEITPFAHVGLVPVQPFRVVASILMIALGVAAALAAGTLFARRDLISG
jgi:ABC-2 type transport system permease protein